MKTKRLNKKAKRIIENIFDVILRTSYYDTARKELTKDLAMHNVSIDRNRGVIDIEDSNGMRVLYTIEIRKE